MTRVAIIGASIGGLPAAYESRALLDKRHKVTVLSNVDYFQFAPSNPWVSVRWRTRKDSTFPLAPVLHNKRIEFIHAVAERIEPQQNRVITAKGEVPYDYLIIAAGPRHNFSAVPGLRPERLHPVGLYGGPCATRCSSRRSPGPMPWPAPRACAILRAL